ncbi:mannosyl-3-phosphoglycerate synthase [Bombardia bombarda]|uniref:Mannosyl-3-phosphoglycerate synthase n=1 Tax=Bombardia bombarda TaxID=252184 RepID=A0AA39TGC5_9PEZI|nr:mannosyl-3-phosphoglycerate synthase [Bombardia bombarda]
MRISTPTETYRVPGTGLFINSETQVLDLEAEHDENLTVLDGDNEGHHDHQQHHKKSISLSPDTLTDTLRQTVIVVPCKNEELEVIRGVLSGIPPACIIILVSNSRRTASDDHYAKEVAMLRDFCRQGSFIHTTKTPTARKALAIHQGDPGAASAFRAMGMPQLSDEDANKIYDGKGEGMLLGIALAAMFCRDPRLMEDGVPRRYIGFVDADNFVPGSVHEYCRVFAAGFAMYPSKKNVMVRIHWPSKPKVRNGQMICEPEGRSSRVVNMWLNRLLAAISPPSSRPSNDRIVVTGNAGEHAMTMDLAVKMVTAGGYAIEPFHFIHLLNQLATSIPDTRDSTVSSRLDPTWILQIRTRNPHVHRQTGEGHIRHLWTQALGTIYHGFPTLWPADSGPGQNNTQEPPVPRLYPAMADMDLDKLRTLMLQQARTLVGYGPWASIHLKTATATATPTTVITNAINTATATISA